MANLALTCDINRIQLGIIGISDILVSLLQKYEYSKSISVAVILTVANLAESSNLRRLLGDAGVFDGIITAMQKHSQASAVAKVACKALGNLTMDNPENIARLGTSGCCQTLITVMESHSDCYQVSSGL